MYCKCIMKNYLIFFLLLIIIVLPSTARADATPFYFNGASGSSWDDLGSWWQDSDYTVPADYLPVEGDIYIDAPMDVGPSSPTIVNNLYIGTVHPENPSYFSGELTVNGNAYFGIQGVTAFDTYLALSGVINGNATFYSSAYSSGHINGTVNFYETSILDFTGVVTGNANFYDESICKFLASSDNNATVTGTKKRHFLQNATTSLNYVENGPWTIVANNAIVHIDAVIDATIGSPTFTTLQTIGSGTFTYATLTVSTAIASDLRSNSATLNGSVTSIGGQQIAERGFIYGLTTAYGATTTEYGSFGVGSFDENISGLIPRTAYHYKSYATNAQGTSYGNDYVLYTSPQNQPTRNIISSLATDLFPIGNTIGTNNFLYIVAFNSNTLSKYNVTDKSNPVFVGSATTTNQPGSVFVEGDYAYVTTYDGKLLTYNISASSSPILVNTYSFPSPQMPGNPQVYDGYLYTVVHKNSAGGRVSVFSLADPAQPTLHSEMLLGTDGGGDVQKRGNYIYVADYFGYTLQVWDVSNLASPIRMQLITGINEPLDYHSFEPWKILLKENALYLMDDEIIQVYDISSSTNMTYVTTVLAYKDVEGAVIWGDILIYNASFDGIIAIYDIRDPLQPILATTTHNSLTNRVLSIDSQGYTYSSVNDTIIIYDAINKPTLSTVSVSGLTSSSVTLQASITSDNNSSSTIKGFNYGISSSYGNTASSTGIFGVGSFSQTLTNLSCGTTYHFQAFATNIIGTATTSDYSFSTTNCPSSGGGSSSNSTGSLISPQALKQLLSWTTPTRSTSTHPFTTSFIQNLTVGSLGDDVKNLQIYLNAKGYTVAMFGPGSVGQETNFFGRLTRAALARFQKDNNIYPSIGYFGPITRAFITKNP